MISGASGAPAPGAPAQPALEWKFSQVFGERAVGEEVQEGMGISMLLTFLSSPLSPPKSDIL